MILWIIGNGTDPEELLLLTLLCRITQNNLRKSINMSGTKRALIILNIEHFGKDARRESLRSVLSFLENLEYVINIFQQFEIRVPDHLYPLRGGLVQERETEWSWWWGFP